MRISPSKLGPHVGPPHAHPKNKGFVADKEFSDSENGSKLWEANRQTCFYFCFQQADSFRSRLLSAKKVKKQPAHRDPNLRIVSGGVALMLILSDKHGPAGYMT
jgi:hypothetical protein